MTLRFLFGKEHDAIVAHVNEVIATTRPIASAAPGTRGYWDEKWKAVHDGYVAGDNPDLVPPYFPQTFARVGGCYAATEPLFLPTFQRALVTALAQKYFPGYVVEIGCGGGFNLRTLTQAGFTVFGYDYSGEGVACAKAAGLEAHQCGDLREDCAALEIPSGAGVLTCDCMERLGADWGPLFERLCRHDGVIIHIEPFEEMYGDDPMDVLAKQYHRAKGYLTGYLPALRNDARVEILEACRPRVGSLLTEGFSYVVWRAVK